MVLRVQRDKGGRVEPEAGGGREQRSGLEVAESVEEEALDTGVELCRERSEADSRRLRRTQIRDGCAYASSESLYA
jgi:hypothetical protein